MEHNTQYKTSELVAKMIVSDHSLRKIANILGISESSVKKMVKKLKLKHNCTTLNGLAAHLVKDEYLRV